MKKLLLSLLLLMGVALSAQAQGSVSYEYMQMSSVESVVPGGLGRSRLLLTSADGKEQEIELKNFFSLTGINFKNITNNDVTITGMITQLTAAGWELAYVTSGVYGVESSTGIFITRYMFRRAKR